MQFKIENIIVTFVGIDDSTETEAQNYIDFVNQNKNDDADISSITVSACNDGMIDLDYTLQGEKFERIRRITGCIYNKAMAFLSLRLLYQFKWWCQNVLSRY